MSQDETSAGAAGSASILHRGQRMFEPNAGIRVVELDTLDRHGGRALMVHLPSTDGRSRVAFVPVKGTGVVTEGVRARLLEDLLST